MSSDFRADHQGKSSSSFWGADRVTVSTHHDSSSEPTDIQGGSSNLRPLQGVDTWEFDQSANPVSPISPEYAWSAGSSHLSPPSPLGSPFLPSFATRQPVTYWTMDVSAAPIVIHGSPFTSTDSHWGQRYTSPAYPSLEDLSPISTESNYRSLTPISGPESAWSDRSHSVAPASTASSVHIPLGFGDYKEPTGLNLVNTDFNPSSTMSFTGKQTANMSRWGQLIGEKTRNMASTISHMWTGRRRT